MVEEKEKKKQKGKNSLFHWTDVVAEKIIRTRGNKKKYVVQSGITPSGVIHLGNFREAVTVDLVRLALEKRGKKVEFLYVWDDYDVLRKVPKNLPKQKMIEENLRKPVFKIPDPFGCHKNYAEHFERSFEEENKKVGIEATFVYSHERYLSCEFAKEIKMALEKTEMIKEILNEYRKEPLSEEWLPIFVFCDKCNKDTIKNLEWVGGYNISYVCECGHEEEFDFRKKGIVTLRWRVDWPMRWHKNEVDFETAGKDHFAAGGSVDTGLKIQEEVYGSRPPAGVSTRDFYEWIGIKGEGQFASSLGKVITLTEALEVYEPEIVRYLFAGTRPNREFSISFDTDVLAIYEEFDKVERIYFGVVEVREKETEKAKVTYELSCVGPVPKEMPYQPSFRHLTTVLQIKGMDVGEAVGYFEKEIESKFDRERLKVRAECAKNWIQKYAPEEFRFSVQDSFSDKLKAGEKKVLKILGKKLLERDWTDKELHEEMYILCKNSDLEVRDFFRAAYKVLIGKERGPRLASFILEIGKKKVSGLFGGIR